jgi:hypothetical protein
MKPTFSFTRRDFLKLSASGAWGCSWPESASTALASRAVCSHGRVLMSGLFMYASPAFNSESWKAFGKDQVVPISEVVEGEAGNPYNTAWYRIGEEGFTYSGWVQPVETLYNKPVFEIRAEGRWGRSPCVQPGARSQFLSTGGATITRPRMGQADGRQPTQKGLWYESTPHGAPLRSHA